MNTIEINRIKKDIKKLEDFCFSKKEFDEHEIIVWVAKCVSLFSELNIHGQLISDFIEYYKPKNFNVESVLALSTTPQIDRAIGNFKREYCYWNPNIYYKCNIQSYLATVAFEMAYKLLEKQIEENRLVPKWLINSFAEKNEYTNIYSSLVLLENNYQTKDPDGLFKNSVSLLDSILTLDFILKGKSSIGGRLECLMQNAEIMLKFGISEDYVKGLNCGRIQRNVKVVHKNLPIKYDIPFLVSVSYAYLVITFLEIAMSKGELIR